MERCDGLEVQISDVVLTNSLLYDFRKTFTKNFSPILS